uniref:Family with sequence similarity 187 member A n=1 Tax=Kryptolebias marmoratus TaxID=37003 RepID=A0A3Q3AVE6_KRYMA
MLLTYLSVVLLLYSAAWSFEAPEDKQDVFANRACPAFLTFRNTAYLAGVTVELPCHCKPQEVQSVVWFFRKHEACSDKTKVLTDHQGNKLSDSSQVPHSGNLQSRFSIRLFSLLIFRARPNNSGLYICGSNQKDFFFAYDLDIQETLDHCYTPFKDSYKPLLRPVFLSYQSWSVCDRCGVPGEQVRVGLCYVQSRFLHVRYRWANQTVASCGSGALPGALDPLKQSRVGPKLEVKSCEVLCPTESPPPLNLVALMAFLGYSFASLPVQVPVFYLNHPTDRVLTLGCPGARPDMAVAWDQGFKPIYRLQHKLWSNISTTPLRLQIDMGHHLLFQPAKTQDSGIYYCWLQGRRAAEIHLLVYPHLGGGQSVLSHPDFPAAVQTVLKAYAVMICLFCLLLLCRAGLKYLSHKAETHVD